MMIYADNAATTKMDAEVFEAMRPYFCEEFANPSQPYGFSRRPRNAIATAREVIASCINAHPEEIYFTSGGTESDNWAIKGIIATAKSSKSSCRIITSAIEHKAVLRSCESVEKLGCPVVYMLPDRTGTITLEILAGHISGNAANPALVSVMLANNELGTIQPVKELCRIAHEHGALFHTDAVQAMGHIRVDVQELGVDMLSASAHKFNGPRGVGFLYVREGVEILPYVDGGSQESGMRAGTENTAAIVGMAEALKGNVGSLAENMAYVFGLEAMLMSRLDEYGIPYVKNGEAETFSELVRNREANTFSERVSNDREAKKLPGLVSLSFAGKDGEAILHRMDLLGICISTGSACNSKNTNISHVLRAIGLDETLARGTVRISLGKHNTPDDVEAIASALRKVLTKT